MYGITETTVHVTYRPITLLDLEKKMGSVIGLPIPDLQVHLLDHNLNLVPVGVPGEIYVGGEGVAQGYLNRKELTAERFIPDPFRGVGKLYRSGDLARRLETGELEYIGRMDQQVQIRGFRVEMGEIENVLDGNPNIRKSIVLAREDTPEENRLVAYLVAEGEERPTVNELRGALREKLPDYMVPSAFVFMDKFPLTANGKIDKKALPKPDTDRPDLQDVFVAPRTETEKTLARIWSEVLGIEKIGIHDDFFDLGGHSLSTLSVTSLINAHYGCNLPPAALFEHKSIASVSALLNSKDQCNGSNLTPNSPETSKPINGPKADLNLISELMSMKNAKTPAYCNGEYPCRMRTSWICRWLLGPLYRISRRRPRSIIQYLILKLEGGPLYTNTLRSLYRECHDIEIGKYSSYWFDYDRVPPGTKVGNYSLIHSTGVLFAGNHPRNTVSVHPFFFNSDLDFSSGYEIPRAKIQIGNDVFIGHNSIVLFPTRRISDGAVISAGSVVTGDVPPYAIMGGYPATILGYRFSKEKIEAIRRTRWWELSLEELEPVKEQFMLPVEGETIR
jgi:acetyltransferase-like isoleucine patch superfamily enzyme/acyl carrier protein